MCTYTTERLELSGSAKVPNGWFAATTASVYYDHPVHAPAGHTLNIDVLAPELGPSARVALELSADSARALASAIVAALGAVPSDLVE
jgi:hypothetical protein